MTNKWTQWMRAAALGVACVIALSGCGKAGDAGADASADDGQITIGLSFDSLLIERWQKDKEIFIAEAEKLGAKCVFLSADGDAMKQNDQCNSLLGQGIDVLVIIPKSATAAARAVQAAKKEGVPVLSYDRLVKNADVDLYLSFDNERVGEMQAEYLVSKKPKGKYFMLGGAPDDNNALMFRDGQMNVIQPLVDKGDITIVGDNWADGWSPEKAYEITRSVLVAVGTDLDVIVSSNDGTAGGVVQALKAQGMDGKVLVSGQDADLEGCRRILAGTQSMTVYKPLKELASTGAALAVKLAKGEEIETDDMVNNGTKDVPSVLLDPIALDQDNLVDVLTKDGYYTLEELTK
jgi:D-xylose transport system substrate-binding protein